mgnify:FL=1
MKAKKELAKRIIATFQLKTLVRFLKVQSSVGLTDEEKNVEKEVNELIPEIYTDEDLKGIISKLLLENKSLNKILIHTTNYSVIHLSKILTRYTSASIANKRYKTTIVILSIALLVSLLGIIFVLLF